MSAADKQNVIARGLKAAAAKAEDQQSQEKVQQLASELNAPVGNVAGNNRETNSNLE